ncbi:putative hydrolase YtaP [Triticum urartu]|uniref:putative hydrolase YtaP n=1 Tax=Triticum dicoccoides TaxID=85692 RepID=UPI001891A854|nr:putative hydrolase YtaP [Triticum dicoccoides]XP_048539224.1 putative hydrolase YtaP [Triticum urartu]
MAAAGDLRSEYLQVLLSRRREPQVPLSVEQGTPVTKPLFQGDWPLGPREAMESCPRKEVEDFHEKLVEENFFLITESGEQGRVPVLLLKLNDSTAPERKPVVVILHSSYKCKEWVRPLLEAYASRGYIAVSIDSRYHGERASHKNTYTDALKAAWRNGDTMPFIFDTAWDLIKLADHLSARKDVDPSRIGITGESLGGMHSWFGAFVDTRYSVVVPIVGFQGFRWAIDNNMWEARVNSIRPVFEEAATDLGKSEIDSEVVEKVWDRIAPGLASRFDAPYSVPLIAPRPLLLLNGAEDPCCPIAGLQEPASRVAEAYEKAGSAEKFKFIVEPGVEHMLTANMVKEASEWFDRFLQ